MRIRKFIFILAALVGLLASCSETDESSTEYDNWQERNEAYFTSVYTKASTGGPSWRTLRSYTKKADTTKPTDFIAVEVLATGHGGASPMFTDSVEVHYQGRLMPTTEHPEGLVFDSSWSGDYNLATMSGTKFVPSSLIDGFTTALMAMHPGDRWRVTIPYALGYGTTDSGSIPAFSTLTFDITLIRAWKKRV